MDSLGNDLSPFCAFHKNEVTTSRRWLMCASKMCNLGNELNLENSGCLWSCPVLRTPVSVFTERPGAFLHQDSSHSLPSQWQRGIAGFPLQALSWLRSQSFSWGLNTVTRESTVDFSIGMVLLPILQRGSTSFCSHNGWKMSAAFEKKATR